MSRVRNSYPFRWLHILWESNGRQQTVGQYQTRQEAKQLVHMVRPLHWFLLLWVSLVYLWGLWRLLSTQLLDPSVYKCWNLASQYDVSQLIHCSPLRFLPSQHLDLLPVFVFTVLMLFHGVLLWIGLSGKVQVRWHWLYFLVQAGMVFVIGLIVRQENVVLSLYLTLALAAIGMLRQARFAVVVTAGSLVLFILNTLLNRGTWEDWNSAFIRVWTSTDVAALGLFLVGYLLLYKQQSRANAKLEAANVQLQASAERIEALTRLTERQRLARELHDTLAQGLVGLTFQLETADGLLTWERPGQAQEIVRQAMARARATLAEARCAIDDLRSEPAEELAFTEAVQAEIHHFTAASGIRCQADLEMLATISLPLQEQVLRVITEGLTNIARHAKARQVWIRVVQEDGAQTIEVRDDGIGFDPLVTVTHPGHYGLVGLRERARLIGGQLEITSAPGSGTMMRFSLPLGGHHPSDAGEEGT